VASVIEEITGTPADAGLMSGLARLAERLQEITVEVRGRRYGAGSGVVWRSDGLIITNSHVLAGDRAEVRLADGRVYESRLAKRDDDRDLAALQIDVEGLTAATIGDSDAVRVGELAVAVGNPLGHIRAVASGIIHSIGKRWITADLRLAPGNSGGPMANAHGEIIGINSMIARGLAVAIPSNKVERFIERGDDARRPRLGVMLRPIAVQFERTLLPALMVLEVEPASAAERSGIMIGDTLIGAGGSLFSSYGDLRVALDDMESSQSEIALDLIRAGKRTALTVTI
jgi:serine protease Do